LLVGWLGQHRFAFGAIPDWITTSVLLEQELPETKCTKLTNGAISSWRPRTVRKSIPLLSMPITFVLHREHVRTGRDSRFGGKQHTVAPTDKERRKN
jgi:hypothetical protein